MKKTIYIALNTLTLLLGIWSISFSQGLNGLSEFLDGDFCDTLSGQQIFVQTSELTEKDCCWIWEDGKLKRRLDEDGEFDCDNVAPCKEEKVDISCAYIAQENYVYYDNSERNDFDGDNTVVEDCVRGWVLHRVEQYIPTSWVVDGNESITTQNQTALGPYGSWAAQHNAFIAWLNANDPYGYTWTRVGGENVHGAGWRVTIPCGMPIPEYGVLELYNKKNDCTSKVYPFFQQPEPFEEIVQKIYCESDGTITCKYFRDKEEITKEIDGCVVNCNFEYKKPETPQTACGSIDVIAGCDNLGTEDTADDVNIFLSVRECDGVLINYFYTLNEDLDAEDYGVPIGEFLIGCQETNCEFISSVTKCDPFTCEQVDIYKENCDGNLVTTLYESGTSIIYEGKDQLVDCVKQYLPNSRCGEINEIHYTWDNGVGSCPISGQALSGQVLPRDETADVSAGCEGYLNAYETPYGTVLGFNNQSPVISNVGFVDRYTRCVGTIIEIIINGSNILNAPVSVPSSSSWGQLNIVLWREINDWYNATNGLSPNTISFPSGRVCDINRPEVKPVNCAGRSISCYDINPQSFKYTDCRNNVWTYSIEKENKGKVVYDIYTYQDCKGDLICEYVNQVSKEIVAEIDTSCLVLCKEDCKIATVKTHCFINEGEGESVKINVESSDCDSGAADLAGRNCGRITITVDGTILSIGEMSTDDSTVDLTVGVINGSIAEVDYCWTQVGSVTPSGGYTIEVMTDKGLIEVVATSSSSYRFCNNDGESFLSTSIIEGSEYEIKEICYDGCPNVFQDSQGNQVDTVGLIKCVSVDGSGCTEIKIVNDEK